MERVAYFVVRAQAAPLDDSAAGVRGVVERLATGEKRPFAGGAELVRLLTDWVAPTNPPTARGAPPADGGASASDT